MIEGQLVSWSGAGFCHSWGKPPGCPLPGSSPLASDRKVATFHHQTHGVAEEGATHHEREVRHAGESLNVVDAIRMPQDLCVAAAAQDIRSRIPNESGVGGSSGAWEKLRTSLDECISRARVELRLDASSFAAVERCMTCDDA